MVYFLHLAIYLPKITQPFQEHMPAPWMAYVWCMNGTCGKLSPPLDNFPVSSFPIHFPHLFALFPSNIPRKSAKLVALARLYPLWELNAHVVQKSSRIDQADIGLSHGLSHGLSSSFYGKRWEKIEKFFCKWRFLMGFDGDIL